jgi:prevent-host-death family protein
MYDMEPSAVSIRELQQHLKRVLARVERGQVVEVTRRRKPVARLTPVSNEGDTAPWPDLEARSRAVFGRRVLGTAATQTVSEGRGER